MYYINFTLFSVWILFWIRNGHLANKNFWDKAWELERLSPRPIWSSHLYAPKWLKSRKLRNLYTMTVLRTIGFQMSTFFLTGIVGLVIEVQFFEGKWETMKYQWFVPIGLFIVTFMVRFK